MELKSVVPWGRSFSEYIQMFNLSESDLTKNILGCGDGPASFNCELTKLGGSVTSIDPLYQFNTKQIKQRIDEVYQEIMPQMLENQSKYIWSTIPSVEALGTIRMSAMTDFINDFEEGIQDKRYIEAALPQLPFSKHQFELALCSHYLFLYSQHLTAEAHLKSVLELCRVAKEVRIYPLLNLSGEVSEHLTFVCEMLEELGYQTSLTNVAYEFQKGAKQMLVVKPKSVT